MEAPAPGSRSERPVGGRSEEAEEKRIKSLDRG